MEEAFRRRPRGHASIMRTEKSPERRLPEPRGLGERIGRLASQKVDPPGKGIAMLVLSLVVVVAVVWQFATGMGAGKAIEKNHPERPTANEGASPGESATPSGEGAPTGAPRPGEGRTPPTVPAPGPGDEGLELPMPTPGSDLAIPAEIGPETKRALRITLSELRSPPRVVDALRHLADVVAAAPEGAERKATRAFVLATLAEAASQPWMTAEALDAALTITRGDPAGADALLKAARGPGLAGDETAPAAIVFLGRFGLSPESRRALLDLAKDPERALHLRLMALDVLLGWGVKFDGSDVPDRTLLELIRDYR